LQGPCKDLCKLLVCTREKEACIEIPWFKVIFIAITRDLRVRMSLIWSLVAAAVAGFDDKMSFAAAVARRREDAAAVIDENAVIDMTAVLDLLSIAAGVPASRPPRPVPRPVPLPIAPNDH